MGFPDRIEVTAEIAHPPAKVWAAITTAEGLAAWFGNEGSTRGWRSELGELIDYLDAA